MGNLIFGIGEIIVGIYCSIQQMNTTHDSIVTALQGGTLVTSHLTAVQLLQVLQENSGKYNGIGWFVAWVTQMIFWGTIMPATPVRNLWLHTAIVVLFLALEVMTDIWYSIATATTLGGAFTIVLTGGYSGALASFAYVAAMAAGSVIIFVDGIHRTERALGPVFAKKPAAAVK